MSSAEVKEHMAKVLEGEPRYSVAELEKIASSNKNPSKFDHREAVGIDTLLAILKNERLVGEILSE